MFKEKLKDYVKIIDVALNKCLPSSNKFCIDFVESLKYGVLNGGKRLRPVLTLAICEMLGGNLNAAVALACGVELIHAGSLIHDDLPCMDNSHYRRGFLSCHAKFGETIAVLAGDGLFLSAFNLLTEAENFQLPSHKIVKACKIMSAMAGFDGMVLGQAMDMNLKCDCCSKEVIDVLAGLKTACLIEVACKFGVLSSEADSNVEIKINSFAHYFGLAFQICDDLIDFNEQNKNLENLKTEKSNYVNVFKNIVELKEKFNLYKNKALDKISGFKNNEFLNYLTNFILDENKFD